MGCNFHSTANTSQMGDAQSLQCCRELGIDSYALCPGTLQDGENASFGTVRQKETVDSVATIITFAFTLSVELPER